MKRVFPNLFSRYLVRPVETYCLELLDVLRFIAPNGNPEPNVVLLTPGIYNSAYFEHSFLARTMGIEIVVGADLVVQDGCRLHEDDSRLEDGSTSFIAGSTTIFLIRWSSEPIRCWVSRELSMPTAEAMSVWPTTIGTGVADDKVTYYFVPKMIRYYLDQDPILPNVETYLSYFDSDRKYILENLDKLVVKSANESGGYGMLMGPQSTERTTRSFRRGHREKSAQLCCSTGDPVVSFSLVLRRSFRGKAHRSSPLHPVRRKDHHHSRRFNASRSPQRLAGRQFLAGRRKQRHLGAERVEFRTVT